MDPGSVSAATLEARHAKIRAFLEERGLGAAGRARVGHGIGLDHSEIPVPAETNENTLKAGMTVVIHSAFSLPRSGKLFIPLGDQIHITADGPEFLMAFPRTLSSPAANRGSWGSRLNGSPIPHPARPLYLVAPRNRRGTSGRRLAG